MRRRASWGRGPYRGRSAVEVGAAVACEGRVGRIRLRHFFSRTPQRGGGRWAIFLFLGNGWRTQIDFLFDAHDFLAIHFHGLDAHDFVADEAHKIHVLRGLAVDPFFVFDFAVMGSRTFLGGRPLA
jgi:hypothetical protein